MSADGSIVTPNGSARLLPARVLGPIDATCVVVGAIVGVGIFFNPSAIAKLCPSTSLALLAWAIGGAIALCGALVFAELGGMYHGSGAQYTIVRDSYGPFPAFLFVFCMSTIIEPGSIAVISMICSKNIIALTNRDAQSAGAVSAMAVLLILSVMAANLMGVRWGSRIQNLTVYAKVAALMVVVIVAMFLAPAHAPAVPASAPTVAAPGVIAGLMAALVPAMFAFGGWQQVLWTAGEVRNPAKNLPRAILLGVLLVVVIYLLVNWAYLELLGVEGVANTEALAADAIGVVWPEYGRRFAAAAVAVSAFGVLNVQLLTAPRLILGMARDGLFFSPFARIHPRFGTPVAALFLLTGIAITLLLTAGADRVDRLVNAVVIVDSVFFVLTGAAVIALRRKFPKAERSVRVPGYPIVPILFVLGELGAIVGGYLNADMRPIAIMCSIWLVVAAAIYFTLFRRHARPRTEPAV